MRSFIVMAMLMASFASAAWNDYTESRRLELDADGIDSIEIKAGAGSMDVTGVDGLDRIVVNATVRVADDDDAAELLEHKMRLALVRDDNKARLDSWFERGLFDSSLNASIDLEISMPSGVALRIDDGSGAIDIRDSKADVSIDDGAGSLELRNVANATIDDGSGSIVVSNATGDVTVIDGSGSIKIRAVQGSVSIDDGSGSIDVDDVGKDLVVVDDGSGGLRYAAIRGTVKEP